MLSAAAQAFDTAKLLGVGHGYWQTSGELSRSRGPRLESELGWAIAKGHTLGAYGFLEPGDAGIGARWRWEW